MKKTDALYGDMDEIRVSMGELNIELEELKKQFLIINS